MYYASKLFGLVDNSFLATFGNGRLYNWHAVEHPYGLAPAGWRVPTQTELNTLITTLGGLSVAGGKAKSTRTGLSPGWSAPNTGASNISGFNILASGARLETGIFASILQFNDSWLIDNFDTNNALRFELSYLNAEITIAPRNKRRGYTVRCLMIDPTNWQAGDTVTDASGNVYTTVKIGTQVWMQSNLKSIKFTNGIDIPLVTGESNWAQLTTPGRCSYNDAAISEYTELIEL